MKLEQILAAIPEGTLLGAPEIDRAGQLEISGIANASDASAGDLVFIANEKYKAGLTATKARFFVLQKSIFSEEEIANLASSDEKIFLIVDNAMVAMAKASQLFEPKAVFVSQKKESFPQATVAEDAEIHPSAEIAPNVYIGPSAKIGARSVLHAGVVVQENVTIGEDCHLYPNVVLYAHSILHNRVRIQANTTIGSDGFGYAQEKTPAGVVHQKIIHTGNVIIHDDVEIGANTSIDRGTVGSTVIHRGVKIDNQVQVGHNCTIEEGAIICGGCGIAGTARIGKYALLAGMVGVGDKIEIGAGAIVAGQSGVEKNIEAGGVYAGHPIKSKREFFKMHVMISKLPEMYNDWKKTQKEKESQS